MPTVPTYGTPNVERSAMPGARLGVQATPDAFGAPLAAAAQNVADSSLGIALQERRKADQVRMLDLERQLGEWENQKLYDPKTGAFAKRGKDAFDLPTTVTQDYDAFTGQLEAGLTSDDQRMAARQLIDSRRVAVGRAVQNHVGGEIRSYEETAFKGVMDTSRDAALANYADPERVATEAARQRMAVEGYARRNGLPPEWVDDTAGKATSQTYAGAIGRMIDRGDDLAAKAAYQRWGGSLTGEDAARIDASLKESSSRAESRRQADDIVTGQGDLQGALAALEAKGIKDTDVYDRTKARIVDHYQLARQAETEVQTNLFDAATLSIDQAKNPADASAVPASTWTALQPKYKRELMAYQAAKAKGIPIATDWDTYYQLRSLASADATRDAFLQTDLRGVRSKLSDGEFKEMVDIQTQLRANRGKADEKLDDWATFDQVVSRRLVDAGMDPTESPKNGDAPRANAFRNLVGRTVAAEQARTGKKLGTEDIGKIADRLLIEQTIKTKRAWYSAVNPFGLNPFEDGYSERKVRTFEIPGAAAAIVDVPPSERALIGTRFQARQGRAPTEAEVLGIYNSTVAGGADGP